jgi:hypothetical protein
MQQVTPLSGAVSLVGVGVRGGCEEVRGWVLGFVWEVDLHHGHFEVHGPSGDGGRHGRGLRGQGC